MFELSPSSTLVKIIKNNKWNVNVILSYKLKSKINPNIPLFAPRKKRSGSRIKFMN